MQNLHTFRKSITFAASFGHSYDMKRIQYLYPIDFIRGNISGRQSLEYGAGVRGYDITAGDAVGATNYNPRMIAKLRGKDELKYFQIRTKTTVNMTAAYRHNLALMGGTGAIYSALLNQKESAIYTQCVNALPAGKTLRAFLTPIIRAGLAAKASSITIAPGVSIVNPWVSSETPNVPVKAGLLSKFNSELSNS